MSGIKELKHRIDSITEMHKITNAMHLIASTKMQKAKNKLEKTEPFFRELKSEMNYMLENAVHIKSRYVEKSNGFTDYLAPTGIVVITADKGLAGAYNHNVIKKALETNELYKNSRFYLVGESGIHSFESLVPKNKIAFKTSSDNPTHAKAKLITDKLLKDFDSEQIDRIVLVYTDFKNTLVSNAISEQLIPIKMERKAHRDYSVEFYPSAEDLLNTFITGFIDDLIFSALVDSFCSEQSSRMMAMESANKNSMATLESLKLKYNHIRQSAITQEITEISAAAKHQKQRLERLEGDK